MTRIMLMTWAAMAWEGVASVRGQDPGWSFIKHPDRVTVVHGKQAVATLVLRDDQVRRPYFYDVRTLDGIAVTRRHPPIAGQDATDHATMHPGVWLAFGDLGGHDFWRNKGRVVFDRFVQEPQNGVAQGVMSARWRYLAADGITPVCHEDTSWRFHARPDGWLLQWESTLRPEKGELVFGDQEEMGLGVRMATPFTVKNGGTIVNAKGRKNEKEVWGQPSSWCAYGGVVNQRSVGVAIFSDPASFRLPWFHARDYGLLVANPFGRNAFTKEAKSRIVVAQGETLRLRFGVLVYSAPKLAPAEIDRAYRDYVALIQGK